MLKVEQKGNQDQNPWERIYSNPEKYDYYELTQPHEAILQVVHYFKSRSLKTVLDLGSGFGRNTLPLIGSGFEVTAVDLSEIAVTKLANRLKEDGLDARVLQADFRKLPFESECFDAVLSVQVINHGYEDDVRRAITEITRVLRPSGSIFITVPGRIANREVRYCLVKTARQVEKRTYIPTAGSEIGQPHFIFNKQLIYEFFDRFDIQKIWQDTNDYYCILGERK